MSLMVKINDGIKAAMKAKEASKLQALRAVKSALLLAQTDQGATGELTEAEEMKLLQKLVKQRKDSAAIYTSQDRADLAAPELEEARLIEEYLPEQLSKEDVTKMVDDVITKTGASSMADMGKVMGMVNSKVSGRADGKTISSIVKDRLSK